MKKYYLAGLFIVVLVVAAVVVIGRHGAPDKQAATGTSVPKNQLSYVALGDSVAAGVGLRDYSDSSACDRTNQSYPRQLAKLQNYKLTSVACSGATITAGIAGPQVVNRLSVAPQLEQLFSRPKPAVISLTAGVNDIRWTDIIQRCYTAVCGTAPDKAALTASLQAVNAGLRDVLAKIQAKYQASPPQVVVTGYYQVFPATAVAGCSDLAGIDASELAWGRTVQASLNDAIRSAVGGYPFAHFTTVDYSGHELCSVDPWIQSLTDKQPYHPTEAGQATIAKSIKKTLQGTAL